MGNNFGRGINPLPLESQPLPADVRAPQIQQTQQQQPHASASKKTGEDTTDGRASVRQARGSFSGSYDYNLVPHPGYGVQAYPTDPVAMYYPQMGPVLLLDPHTGVAYEYDEDTYSVYLDNERRYKRRKNRRKSSDKNLDDDKEEGREKRKHRHHRHHSSDQKPTENGIPGVIKDLPKPVSRSSTVKTTSTTKRRRPDSYRPCDVMISCSQADSFVVQQVKEKLEGLGAVVWVEGESNQSGPEFMDMTAEAIIDAKVLVVILSESSVKRVSTHHHLCLAYLSNCLIFPVNLLPGDQLLPLMEPHMKLLLEKYQWSSLTDPSILSDSVDALAASLQEHLHDLSMADQLDHNQNSPVPTVQPRDRNRASEDDGDDVSIITADKFWEDRMGLSDFVPWDRLRQALREEFFEDVQELLPDQDQQQAVLHALRRKMHVDGSDLVSRDRFTEFCVLHGGPADVWRCVEETARYHLAVITVFSVQSSLREGALHNIGKIQSTALTESLRDLLAHPDPNVRVVTVVTLSGGGASDAGTERDVIDRLGDADRLVREAACHALGRLRVQGAVQHLTHVWRNDVISQVRSAAAAALRQIGGKEVDDVMRVTEVLAEEIRTLST